MLLWAWNSPENHFTRCDYMITLAGSILCKPIYIRVKACMCTTIHDVKLTIIVFLKNITPSNELIGHVNFGQNGTEFHQNISHTSKNKTASGIFFLNHGYMYFSCDAVNTMGKVNYTDDSTVTTLRHSM